MNNNEWVEFIKKNRERVRELRKQGLTLDEIAKIVGVSRERIRLMANEPT